jgi:hypothetical protein
LRLVKRAKQLVCMRGALHLTGFANFGEKMPPPAHAGRRGSKPVSPWLPCLALHNTRPAGLHPPPPAAVPVSSVGQLGVSAQIIQHPTTCTKNTAQIFLHSSRSLFSLSASCQLLPAASPSPATHSAVGPHPPCLLALHCCFFSHCRRVELQLTAMHCPLLSAPLLQLLLAAYCVEAPVWCVASAHAAAAPERLRELMQR